MTNYSAQKGSQKERELRRNFEDAGWFAIRSPGSSGGYDLIAGRNGFVLAMEMKYVEAGDPVYLTDEELFGGAEETTPLMEAAHQIGGWPAAVVRWKRDTTFYAYPPLAVPTTEGGTRVLHPEKHKDLGFEVPSSVDAQALEPYRSPDTSAAYWNPLLDIADSADE